jgi:hypothetical protein
MSYRVLAILAILAVVIGLALVTWRGGVSSLRADPLSTPTIVPTLPLPAKPLPDPERTPKSVPIITLPPGWGTVMPPSTPTVPTD